MFIRVKIRYVFFLSRYKVMVKTFFSKITVFKYTVESLQVRMKKIIKIVHLDLGSVLNILSSFFILLEMFSFGTLQCFLNALSLCLIFYPLFVKDTSDFIGCLLCLKRRLLLHLEPVKTVKVIGVNNVKFISAQKVMNNSSQRFNFYRIIGLHEQKTLIDCWVIVSQVKVTRVNDISLFQLIILKIKKKDFNLICTLIEDITHTVYPPLLLFSLIF